MKCSKEITFPHTADNITNVLTQSPLLKYFTLLRGTSKQRQIEIGANIYRRRLDYIKVRMF